MRGARGHTQSLSSGMLLCFVPQPGFLIKLKHFRAGAAWDTGKAWLPATRANLALPKTPPVGQARPFTHLDRRKANTGRGLFFFFSVDYRAGEAGKLASVTSCMTQPALN